MPAWALQCWVKRLILKTAVTPAADLITQVYGKRRFAGALQKMKKSFER